MGSSAFIKLRGGDPAASRTQDNISAQMQPVATALAATPIMGAPPPNWIAPTLVGGFANTGGALAIAGFHKDALGYVHMKGALTNAAGTAAATIIFTLPIGYRPAATQRFSVRGFAGAVQAVSITSVGLVSNDLVLAAGDTIDLALSFLGER